MRMHHSKHEAKEIDPSCRFRALYQMIDGSAGREVRCALGLGAEARSDDVGSELIIGTC
jgi:hypothetical protein